MGDISALMRRVLAQLQSGRRCGGRVTAGRGLELCIDISLVAGASGAQLPYQRYLSFPRIVSSTYTIQRGFRAVFRAQLVERRASHKKTISRQAAGTGAAQASMVQKVVHQLSLTHFCTPSTSAGPRPSPHPTTPVPLMCLSPPPSALRICHHPSPDTLVDSVPHRRGGGHTHQPRAGAAPECGHPLGPRNCHGGCPRGAPRRCRHHS